MSRIKAITINVGLVMASIALMLVFIELALHVTHFKYKILPPLEPQGYVVNDIQAGYDISPNYPTTTQSFYDLSYQVFSNNVGCFDRAYASETPYIYVGGDSFAWGWTPLGDKWGKQIEKTVGMRTLTCGVNGYGTKQELLKEQKTMEKVGANPAAIVIQYLGANDVDDDRTFPNYTVANGYRIHNYGAPQEGALVSIKTWLAAHVVLYDIFKDRIYPLLKTQSAPASAIQGPAAPSDDAAYMDHVKNVLVFKDAARKQGARLLFVLVPSKNEVAAGSAQYNDRLKPYLDKAGIAYIDLLPGISEAIGKGAKLYWDFDGHWNPQGNRLAGLLVSRALMKKGIIPNDRVSLGAIESALRNEFSI